MILFAAHDPGAKNHIRPLYKYASSLGHTTDFVDLAALKSFSDILNPKWKGKMASIDPMISGAHEQNLRFFYYHPQIGPEFIKRLYSEMDVTISRDDRQLVIGSPWGNLPLPCFRATTRTPSSKAFP